MVMLLLVTVPNLVTSTTASITALVPVANFSISKTPTGPFQTIVLARLITSTNILTLSGPQSSPYI
jgi:hypothetical protein